jgi:hypothetical protein
MDPIDRCGTLLDGLPVDGCTAESATMFLFGRVCWVVGVANFLAASPGSKGLVPTKGDVFRRSWDVCFVQDLLVGCWLLLVVGLLIVDCLFENTAQNSCETLNETKPKFFRKRVHGRTPAT